jgi:hypothetical protein
MRGIPSRNPQPLYIEKNLPEPFCSPFSAKWGKGLRDILNNNISPVSSLFYRAIEINWHHKKIPPHLTGTGFS